jgi:hypothetical protein
LDGEVSHDESVVRELLERLAFANVVAGVVDQALEDWWLPNPRSRPNPEAIAAMRAADDLPLVPVVAQVPGASRAVRVDGRTPGSSPAEPAARGCNRGSRLYHHVPQGHQSVLNPRATLGPLLLLVDYVDRKTSREQQRHRIGPNRVRLAQ